MTPKAGAKPPKGLLTIDQAAQALGLSPRTVRNWVGKREVAYVRVGDKAIRLDPATVDGLIERGRVPALAAK